MIDSLMMLETLRAGDMFYNSIGIYVILDVQCTNESTKLPYRVTWLYLQRRKNSTIYVHTAYVQEPRVQSFATGNMTMVRAP